MVKKETIWLSGTVIHGSGRGHDLGFPTANVALDNPKLRPGHGIYAGWAKINNQDTAYPTAIHVGPVPTFNKKEITVELHLLNWAGKNLYNKKISFTCTKFLRDVEKFATIEELKSAIKKDCLNATEFLRTTSFN